MRMEYMYHESRVGDYLGQDGSQQEWGAGNGGVNKSKVLYYNETQCSEMLAKVNKNMKRKHCMCVPVHVHIPQYTHTRMYTHIRCGEKFRYLEQCYG